MEDGLNLTIKVEDRLVRVQSIDFDFYEEDPVNESKKFQVMSVCSVTGKIFWSKAHFPAIDEAVAYINKRMNHGRRILIWEDIENEVYLRAYMFDKTSGLITV